MSYAGAQLALLDIAMQASIEMLRALHYLGWHATCIREEFSLRHACLSGLE